MKILKYYVFVYFFLIIDSGITLNIISINQQMLYEYIGSVSVGAKPQQNINENANIKNNNSNNSQSNRNRPFSGWTVKGKLTIQRQNEETMAAALTIDEVELSNSGEKFPQNKEMYPPYKSFKIALDKSGKITHLVFKESDPIWSTNFKRAIASYLQFQINSEGAYVVEENGIHGKCSTEYYVANKTESMSVRKTPELKTCTPFSEAIHLTRSNVPPNLCEFDFQKNVIVGNEAQFEFIRRPTSEYYLNSAHVKGTAFIHTFESTGEAQYVHSEFHLKFVNESTIDNPIDIETGMSTMQSSLSLLPLDLKDPTGGRHPQLQETLISSATELLNSLAGGLENSEINFNEPYDSTVSDIIRVLSQMNFDSLHKLFLEVDIGTSYRQETIRNIFFEIIPRIGTKASVQLTRDLVVNKLVKPTTAVQLLISLPFHIYELSGDMINECEAFLNMGPDRPDVRQAAALSFATLVHNVFVAGKITKDIFENYVQKYFNLYLSVNDYEEKMLYLQALSNLQLGNVANYLDPIIRDENENNDIKFLAAWATMPLAHTRPEKIYELYWPIFESKNSTLELRISALTLLLISNPTPARLISLHRIIQDETSPHLINFYRSTVKSISETTYPCYQHLRRMFSYMYRHLPQETHPRYWVTGNYIFDYRDSKFGIGAMLQAFLVGDEKSDLPVVAYFKFDTEALGKFTGQLALYIKARGLPDALIDRLVKMNAATLKIDTLKAVLESMKAPKIENTPLHLELIIQMEGKTVLSYYLNQKIFQNLTYGDVINRLSFLLIADSHINMQTVRWPFMAKYVVPTVLGTPADVLLQNTVLMSLRGNITQQRAVDGVTRTHQIDIRYSSYASCNSRSYNPFLNLDHEINREQGFFAYIPINNDLNANITTKSLKFSFTRPEKHTSGLAFKSRSITSTKGYMTRSSPLPYKEIFSLVPKYNGVQLVNYDIEDIGLSIEVNSNYHEMNTYRLMLLKSEFIENGFLSNTAINTLMYIFGLAQLSSIHIGNDRNSTLLVHNKEFTRVEGSLSTEEIDGPDDKVGQKIDFSLMHINNEPDIVLHRWNVIVNFLSYTKQNLYKVIGIVRRSTHNNGQAWKGCIDLTYTPLIFLKKPHTFFGKIKFGPSAGEKSCPLNVSEIEITAKAEPSLKGLEIFNVSAVAAAEENDHCPKEILKFDPIPSSKYCTRKTFEHLTAITNYRVDLKFSNMPEWFDVWSSRFDHFVSALSEKKIDHLGLDKQIDLKVEIPQNEFWITFDMNGVQVKAYHIPFVPKIDSKYDTVEQLLLDSGVKRSCSVINSILNSFDDVVIDISQYYQLNNISSSCSILLAAECSLTPKLAVFLLPLPSSSNTTNQKLKFGIKVYVGGDFITFNPNEGLTENAIFIKINDHDQINVKDQSYQFPLLEKFYYYSVTVDEHGILVIENELTKSLVKFDMKNILSIQIFDIQKDKMCGLCSQPLNAMESYTLCN